MKIEIEIEVSSGITMQRLRDELASAMASMSLRCVATPIAFLVGPEVVCIDGMRGNSKTSFEVSRLKEVCCELIRSCTS